MAGNISFSHIAGEVDDLKYRSTTMLGQLTNLTEIVEDLANSVRVNSEMVKDNDDRVESIVNRSCSKLKDLIMTMAMELRRDMEERDHDLRNEMSKIRRAVADLHQKEDGFGTEQSQKHSAVRRDNKDNGWVKAVIPSADSPRMAAKVASASPPSGHNGHRHSPARASPEISRKGGLTSSTSPRKVAGSDTTRGYPNCDGAVADVLEHFEESIATVFVQYSSWSPKGGGTQLMSRADFVKFVKDCHIPQKTNQAIADLVFLKVTLGAVDPSQSRNIQGMAARIAPLGLDSFEESTHEFDIVEFRQALVMIASAVYAARENLSTAQKLRELLVNGVQIVIGHNEDMRYPDPRVRNSSVKMVVSAYRKQIRKIYDHYAANVYERRTGPRKVVKQMSQEDFLDLLKEYDLRGLVSNHSAKEIFDLALKRRLRNELAKQGDSSKKIVMEPQISFDEFLDLLATLALEIYDGEMYAQSYPNPEDKVQKLLVKLVVLQTPVSQSIRGNRVRNNNSGSLKK